jgi:hypothetical protein
MDQRAEGVGNVASQFTEQFLLLGVGSISGRDGHGENTVEAAIESQAGGQSGPAAVLADQGAVQTFGLRFLEHNQPLLFQGAAHTGRELALGQLRGHNPESTVKTG